MTAVLGLGLAAIGRPAYITSGRADSMPPERSVEALRARTHELLDAAWAGGVRYFDAARSYGLAEEFLGAWLVAHLGRRAELTIGSKWGYRYVGQWRMDAPAHERKDHSLAAFEEQWPATLAALGGPPDVELIHSVTPESPALDDPALLDCLRDLADGGQRLGISTSGPHQGEVIDAALALPDSPFSAVQATWNPLEPSAAPALARASAAGCFVVVKEALANGRLAPGGDAVIEAIAASRGMSADRLALGAALAQPWADVVLSGAVSLDQLASNLLAVPEADALDGLAMPPEQYWAERSARPWN